MRHKDEAILNDITLHYTAVMKHYFKSRVLGPDTPSVSRIAGWHIRTFMLKIEPGASMPKVKALLRRIYISLSDITGIKSARIHYDVDPA